jgi:histidine kinase
MNKIKGYKDFQIDIIHGNHRFYSALRDTDHRPVTLKIFESNDFHSPEIVSLRREFAILNKLAHAGLISALDFVEFQGGGALVMDKFEGITLHEYMGSQPVSIKNFLTIAIHLSEVLGYLQSLGIIHKDIKPENILINQKTLDIRIIDFGISSLITQEDIAVAGTHMLEGTLQYISPEQTGRMNRSLDYRSDLYSLGVSLYKMLCAKLPFDSADALSIVHAHLAVKPLSPEKIVQNIPSTISKIVMKLLEKSPENRYQSSSGLKADLQVCLNHLEKNGSVPDFEIAKKDFSDKLNISQKIYGREKELKILQAAIEKTLQENSATLFVTGLPGIGKSVLVNEITPLVVQNKGLYFKGKFDQFNRNIPYSAIVDAFRDLIDFILSNSQDELLVWKNKILDELGGYGRLMTDVLPSLELIIGPQPPVQALPSAEAFNRFSLVFQRFMKAIAGCTNTLVLFLDDLQWADSASIQLLEFLISDKENKKMLIVGAYRDNEVIAGDQLYELVRMSLLHKNVSHIHLEPLLRTDIAHLLADTFQSSENEVQKLSELIDAKTKCNPFFVSQFIKSLYKKGLVYFDNSENKWNWSIEKIQESHITDNVIDLVTETLKGLDSETQKLCALAACIGNQFDLSTLALVNEKDIKETADQLWQAITEGVITPLTSNYKVISHNPKLAEKVSYKFLHDRVQQAAYAILSDTEKERAHLNIGKLLQGDAEFSSIEANIFDIVNHFNKGINLIKNSTERLDLAKLNCLAGLKAKKSSAFEPAFAYYSIALDLLPENKWGEHYSFTLDKFNQAAEMAYLSVKPAEVEKITKEILVHAKTSVDSLQAYIVKIAFYGAQGDHGRSISASIEILGKLGVKLPKNPTKLNVILGLAATLLRLRGKTGEDLFQLPEMKDEKWIAAMSVLSIVTGPAYITNTNLFVLIVFKMIALSIKYGKNRFSSFAFAVLGMVLAGMMDLKGVKTYSELSRRLLESFPEDEQYAKVNYCLISLHYLHHPISETGSLMQKNIQKAFDSGDFLYASYSVFYSLALKVHGNYPLANLIAEFLPLTQKLDTLNLKVGLGWTNTFMQFISNLENDKEIKKTLAGDFFDEKVMVPLMIESKNVSGITLMYLVKGILNYILDDYKESLECFNKAEKTLDNMVGTPMVLAFHFYQTLADTMLYHEKNFLQKKLLHFKINKSIKVYKKLVAHSTENNLNRLEILEGMRAFLAGDLSRAALHLKKSIIVGEKNNFTQEVALAYELLAKIHTQTGRDEEAAKSISEARFLYHKWGAHAKVLLIERKYNLIKDVSDKRKFDPDTTKTMHNGSFSTDSLDLQTVIKTSQALSSEINLNDLFTRMIKIVMENAGATACTIMLKENGEWSQRATNRLSENSNHQSHNIIPLKAEYTSELELPLSVALYAIRTQKSLTLNNPLKNPTFANDDYLKRNNPKSILCLPFAAKGDLLGMLYLENDLVADAFSENRLQLLKIVTSQLSISIENAFLYENLEQKVQARTSDLMEKNKVIETEKKKSDELLLNILPEEIANELKSSGHAKARLHSHATVLFSDIQGFTRISETLSPEELVDLLHRYFSKFDEICAKHKLEKIKTIGDAYMAMAGVPEGNKASALDVVRAAKEMIDVCKAFQATLKASNKPYFELRTGINTGPLVSGIVGKSKFQFDIWGDTVNVASRLEQTSEPGKVNISRSTYDEVKDEFPCTPRGLLPIKNKGDIEMFFVD